MKRIIFLLSILLVVLSAGYLGYKKITAPYHIHSDFAVFINGDQLNFAQSEYMTSTDVCAADYNSKHTHLHDENGSVVHIHRKAQTVGDFFKSIGFVITEDSLTIDNLVVYKNGSYKKWQFFINGIATSSLQNYIFKDLDQIVLSYGNTDTASTSSEIAKVTRNACVYSEKCPKPADIVLPTERCGSDE